MKLFEVLMIPNTDFAEMNIALIVLVLKIDTRHSSFILLTRKYPVYLISFYYVKDAQGSVIVGL